LTYIQQQVIQQLFEAGSEATVLRNAAFGRFRIARGKGEFVWATVLSLWRKQLLIEIVPFRLYRLSEAGCREGLRLTEARHA
jgi:hypothetical protein